MKKVMTYMLLCCTALLLSGCSDMLSKQKQWNVSLSKKDKKPYGTYLSRQSLQYYFPNTAIEDLPSGFRFSSMDGNMMYPGDGPNLMVLVGLNFYISEDELTDLIRFAGEGNELVLFGSLLDNKLEEKLRFNKTTNNYEEFRLMQTNDGKENIGALQLQNQPGKQYGYEGRTLTQYFELDTAINSTITDSEGNETDLNDQNQEEPYKITGMPDVLGYAKNKPNFIRYTVGEGHITIHAAPLVLSNYFLLQDGNRAYLDGIWQAMPNNIQHIYWNEYFKRRADRANLGVLWEYPATRWAFILAVFTLLMYVLFESKRRQRIIPIVQAPVNSSVIFAETVGRLYYNTGNHANLAEKMVQHFLEWVRTHYYMNTNEINDQFRQQLTVKSGLPESVVREMTTLIYEVKTGDAQIDETYLYHLHQTIHQFQSKHSS